MSTHVDTVNAGSPEIDDLVAFLNALDGEGYQDTAPTALPE